MLFNSFAFIFAFLPIALIGFKVLAGRSSGAVIWWLALLSLAFYGAWNLSFLPVLVGSVLFNYGAARLLAKFKQREALQHGCLVAAISLNLISLCYFKYLFATLNYFAHIGFLPFTFQAVILPLGISFFTFTQIAYLIDLKQGEAELEPFRNYLFFVTFFPHLIAGPILHHHEIMPQLSDKRRFRLNPDDLAPGITLFAIGLFKKTVLADKIAPYASNLFDRPSQATFLGAWFGVLCYAAQLYFDFSGYSDMAIGIARMFSIRFPLNFNSPYKAKSIIEFWQRWHMTLTRYITLYIYNPVSLAIVRRSASTPKRKSRLDLNTFTKRVAMPTLFSMFLAGVWHGAGIQFMVFGLLHGLYISVNHAWRIFGSALRARLGPVTSRYQLLFSFLSVLCVFIPVLIGFVFFRAKSVADAAQIVTALFGSRGFMPLASEVSRAGLILLTIACTIIWGCPNSQEIIGYSPDREVDEPRRFWQWAPASPRWQPNVAWAFAVVLFFTYALMAITDRSEFLYFQF